MNKPVINVCDEFDGREQVRTLVLALGSNHHHERSFELALAKLGELGELDCSDVAASKDFTGKTERVYHNACVLLDAAAPNTVRAWIAATKEIERQCGRGDGQDVAMDIDVLAVQGSDGAWCVHQKRLPFKAHERTGLMQVAAWLI
ncbi:hypothetical protein B0181_07460 [Moraxella caviae]|uniref:2-amino-4-hydroxy-6-hydroxymethyldihydropteridine diphosphokinase n=1 Tax=Moraxella caviae TaxID=34060 RepID=A0A1T0A052_9GAMM|nr:2-amino-4-hydroxy-6-hydroxymethyldihydropteridine diphosphokinase [Moraxella caviae]OOR88999.1 hypothetical protein B0181_07460 [Moraxella caviae]STZ14753.1 2-amino-4-hydroxy-6-hydroxymethyldihydropteridinediphosphokinase [Moraxella caviae]VEW13997.1 2-amino-4-hydroxy-6-hydroxymethyldihydropteridinediphosphokinase [Moraxella caviae]